jgi:splicing factor 3A subunit 3
MFSGEEVYGKYLDLYANHTTFNNMKSIGKRIGYLQYLDALLLAESGLIHMDIPKETRLSRDYETCVTQMLIDRFAQRILGTYLRYTPISRRSCAGHSR